MTLYLNTELEKNIIAQLVTPNVNVSAIKTPTVARLSCAEENPYHREPLDLQISEQLVNIPAALFSPCTPLYGDNGSIRDRIVQAQQRLNKCKLSLYRASMSLRCISRYAFFNLNLGTMVDIVH